MPKLASFWDSKHHRQMVWTSKHYAAVCVAAACLCAPGCSGTDPLDTTEGTSTDTSETGETTDETTDEPTTESETDEPTTEAPTTDDPTEDPSVCGNGIVEANEPCDDGNEDEDDACLSGCIAAECGDGVVWSGVESCDDGNDVDDDACSNNCAPSSCGDGVIQSGESCDDANLEDTDACTNACQPAICGDGIIWDTLEACDDAGESMSCDSDCSKAACGDGQVNASADEVCDDGNDINSDECPASCQPATCGDGFVLDTIESCDDGNDLPNDGCEADCTISADYNASGPQVDVPQQALVGWEPCWSSTYAEGGSSLALIASNLCPGKNLMLACRPVDSDTFTLLAHAPREDVLTDTSNSNEPHLANGSAWYYATAWSWGFAREGDPINRQSCDNLEQPHPEERLCWHTSSNDVDAGYRCGVKIVEGDPMWERVILQSG